MSDQDRVSTICQSLIVRKAKQFTFLSTRPVNNEIAFLKKLVNYLSMM
jgi:hypothetical protein